MGDILEPAWAWLFSAVVLLVIEVVTPGLLFVFFGLAALVMALVVALWPAIPGAWQSVLYAALSIGFLVALRRTFKRVFTGRRQAVAAAGGLDEGFVGHNARVVEAIDGLAPGRVEFNGTTWNAVSPQPLAVGALVEIVAKDNLTLTVRQAVKQQIEEED